MSNNRGSIKEKIRRITAVLLCALISFAFIPDFSYALEGESDEISIDITELTKAEELQTIVDIPLDDDDVLLEGYMNSRLKEELGSGKRKAADVKRRDNLSYEEKEIYDAIKEVVYNIAAGRVAKAEINIDVGNIFRPYYVQINGYNAVTSASLGISSGVLVKKTDSNGTYWTFSDEAKAKLFDFEDVFNALMADEPYALYWYDKTEGVTYGVTGMYYYSSGNSSDIFFLPSNDPALKLLFTVSSRYRPAGGGRTDVNTAETGAAALAVESAAAIIEDNKQESDIDKLTAYKEEICALTSYNHTAAETQGYPYGDPWQLIYVFDRNPSTNVVCEGYAKAFQYLCDNTDFETDIECDSVTGDMVVGQKGDRHMWNILHMDDGKNYLADITNSDTGTSGQNGGLFISPAMSGGSVRTGFGYDVNNDNSEDIRYVYDTDTRSLFSESELEMSTAEYETPSLIKEIEYTWASDGSSCTATGKWSENDEPVTDEAVITSSLKKKATCTSNGTTTYIAKFNTRGFKTQRKDINDIPAKGHSWNSGTVVRSAAEGVNGIRVLKCTRCGGTRSEIIPAITYPTDLPAVKISKPKAAKNKLTAKWKKVSKKNQKKIAGIEIQVATDPGFTNIVKTATAGKKKTSKAFSGLQAKTKYYVRVRAYSNAADGKHVSVWKYKSVKTK